MNAQADTPVAERLDCLTMYMCSITREELLLVYEATCIKERSKGAMRWKHSPLSGVLVSDWVIEVEVYA